MQQTAKTPAPSVTVAAPATQASPAQAATQMVYRDPATGEAYTITPPTTARDMQALKARREELSNQLQSVDSRRSKLMSQLKSTGDPVAVKGLEDRLALLDQRQLQLESDIQQTGQQMSSAAAGLIASSSDAPRFAGFSQNQVMALSVLSIIFIFFPIAAGISKAFWRRSNKPAIPPQALTETAQRLERLESSVDAIAIEVERISEGQRFVTKLLAEGQVAPALGSGAPDTVRVGK
jgi:hypothetical protein